VKSKKVVQVINGGKFQTSTSKPYYDPYLNSGVYDPATGDILFGTLYGNVDIVAGEHGTVYYLGGVGSNATASNNSVTGIDILAGGKGTAMTYGVAGMGSPTTATYRFYPINLTLGLPAAGKTWGSRLFGGEGGAPAVLAFGLSNKIWMGIPLPLDLGFLGAKGNNLYCSQELVLGTVLAGTGSGVGEGSFTFTLPPASLGLTMYCQWLTLDKGANPLGLVTTNARTLMIQ